MKKTTQRKGIIICAMLAFAMVMSFFTGIILTEVQHTAAYAADGAHSHDGVTCNPLTRRTQLENDLGGSFYLTGNFETYSSITINGDVTLCLNGFVFEGNTITVDSGASLTIIDCGTTSHNYNMPENGAWQPSNNGIAIIEGGILQSKIVNNGTFELKDGTICGVSGVVITNAGTATIGENGAVVGNYNGSTSTGNNSTPTIIYNNGRNANFTNNGSITNNTAAVYVVYNNSGTFINAGKISYNESTGSTDNNSIVCNKSSFTNNGEINGNTSELHTVYNDGTFTNRDQINSNYSNGSRSSNSIVYNSSTFTNYGEINSNYTKAHVVYHDDNTFYNYGQVCYNEITGQGAGVYLDSGNLVVGGSSRVTENRDRNGNNSNICVVIANFNSPIISFDSGNRLTANASMGVHCIGYRGAYATGAVTSGYSVYYSDVKANTYFFADLETQIVILERPYNSIFKEIYLSDHTHTLDMVRAESATCTTEGHEEYYKCNNSDCGKLFADAQGRTPTTIGDVTIYRLGHDTDLVPANPETCTTDGNIAHYKCTRSGCDALFMDEDATEPTTLADVTIPAKHILTFVPANPETCTTDGNLAHYKCTRSGCDALFMDEDATEPTTLADVTIPAKHILTFVPANSETCTINGNIAHYKCTRSGCDALFMDEDATEPTTLADVTIPAKHILEKVEANPETCTTDGNIAHYKCSRSGCGKLFLDEDATEPATLADVTIAAKHILEEVEANAETCTTDGNIAHYKCTRSGCGALFMDEDATEPTTLADVTIPAKHILTFVPANPETCTTDGNIAHYKCTRSGCGALFMDEDATEPTTLADVTLPAKHILEKVEANPETCTTDGNIAHYKCTRSGCGALFMDEDATEPTTLADVTLPAKHILTFVPANSETCTTDGNLAHYKCTRSGCGALFMDEDATEPTTLADVTIPAKHILTFVPANSETCTTNGNIAHYKCTRSGCGALFMDEDATEPTTLADVTIPAKHILTFVPANSETCTTDGNIAHYKCTRNGCDALFMDEDATEPTTLADVTIPAKHILEFVDANAETCTTDGNIAHYKCSRSGCGELFEDEDATVSTTLANVTIPAKHILEFVDANAETCTTDGNIAHYKCTRSGCGALFMDEDATEPTTLADVTIPAKHILTFVPANPETCTTDGNIAHYKCTRSGCGELFMDEDATEPTTLANVTIPAKHILEKVEANPETCTTDGNKEHYKCTRDNCGKLFWDEEATLPATLDEVTIPAEHILIFVSANSETCTTDGNHAHYKCIRDISRLTRTFRSFRSSSCDAIFWDEEGTEPATLDEVTIPAKHLLELVPANPGTCTTDGNEEHYKCTRDNCGELFLDDEATEPTDEDDVIIPAEHALEKVEANPATCTTNGNKEHYMCTMDDCSELFWDADATLPATLNEVTIGSLGHDMSDATCTEAPTCKRDDCDYTEGTSLGHDWTGEWTVIEEPTATKDGKKETLCTRGCGEKKEAPIPATGSSEPTPTPSAPGVTPTPSIPSVTPTPSVPSVTPTPSAPSVTPNPSEPSVTPTPSEPGIQNPNTGDNSMIKLCIAMLVISMGVIILLIAKASRKNCNSDK